MEDVKLPENIEEQVQAIVAQAPKKDLACYEDAVVAVEFLTQSTQALQVIEEQRKRITKPMLDAKREVDAFFKKVSEKLGEVDSSVRGMIKNYVEKNPEDKRIGEVTVQEKEDIELIDESLIPREYLVPDLFKIKSAILNGKEVPGARKSIKRVVQVRIKEKEKYEKQI